jgi:hypothetical protein
MKYKRLECSARDLSGRWRQDYKSDSNGSGLALWAGAAGRTKTAHGHWISAGSGMLFEHETKRNNFPNLFDKESRLGVIDCRVDGS